LSLVINYVINYYYNRLQYNTGCRIRQPRSVGGRRSSVWPGDEEQECHWVHATVQAARARRLSAQHQVRRRARRRCASIPLQPVELHAAIS